MGYRTRNQLIQDVEELESVVEDIYATATDEELKDKDALNQIIEACEENLEIEDESENPEDED